MKLSPSLRVGNLAGQSTPQNTPMMETTEPNATVVSIPNSPPSSASAVLSFKLEQAAFPRTSLHMAAPNLQGAAQPAPFRLNDPAVQRFITSEQDRLRFRYGRMAPEHPAQRYLQRLAERIPKKKQGHLSIEILPNWKERNACAFPDGTVFVGVSLLATIDCEETLLGILAHEYTHAYREHKAKQYSLKSEEFLDEILLTASLNRLHEWEADIRSVIDTLQALGVSAKPYIDFLENLKGRSLEHGTGRERALNIRAIIHLKDIVGMALSLSCRAAACLAGLLSCKRAILA